MILAITWSRKAWRQQQGSNTGNPEMPQENVAKIYVEFPQSLRKEKEGFKVLPALLIPESGESGEASDDIPEPLRSWSRGEEEPLREG
jgi:hypothetical protein